MAAARGRGGGRPHRHPPLAAASAAAPTGARARAALLPALLLLAAAAALPRCAAQQDEPLKGFGTAQPNATTRVWVSVFLDRLLDVNDHEYQFTAVVYLHLSWVDPRARFLIAANAAQIRAGNRTCERPCANGRDSYGCCDGVWQPFVAIPNTKFLSGDRVLRYALGADQGTDAVYFWTAVLGTWYTPMSFRAFPFDTQELLIQLEATTLRDERGNILGGIDLVPSAAGESMLSSKGAGDDLSDWKVQRVHLAATSKPGCKTIAAAFSTPSAPEDPAPLVPRFYLQEGLVADPSACPALWNDFAPPGLGNAFIRRTRSAGGGLTDRHVFMDGLNVVIVVTRYRTRYVLSVILPIVLSTWLGFLVYMLPRDDMEPRLAAIVALFLALAAIQFVVDTDMPSSSYTTAAQQLTLCSYVTLIMIGAVSVFIWFICNRHDGAEGVLRRSKSLVDGGSLNAHAAAAWREHSEAAVKVDRAHK
ncbi:hypothetical protein Rsub_07011 [Raphidocelis subcapitata]|uniref:Uncharacterized protein n=1 Tax=Raphidocelis subcapitata TaxID=307507 RepID=A0A2V0PBD4_9CHLO|nr:hypothetical protein Rsub_07011 [Raphidocelis subcapitata]|eukprot:GBF94477.1 hypothetical protein Rsub_07011 [Raphidocelis subcapitata]